ncbi:MAG TPA: T9SS type A sorting domain-containing protein, partial [Bacteroidia bacterium]|nr:T9SS type A sorting domain-containing protein [Bacteroidia bacterium]
KAISYTQPAVLGPSVGLGLAAPEVFAAAGPNPFAESTTIRYRMNGDAEVSIEVYALNGQLVHKMAPKAQGAGEYRHTWNAGDAPAGVYLAKVIVGKGTEAQVMQSFKLVKTK